MCRHQTSNLNEWAYTHIYQQRYVFFYEGSATFQRSTMLMAVKAMLENHRCHVGLLTIIFHHLFEAVAGGLKLFDLAMAVIGPRHVSLPRLS